MCDTCDLMTQFATVKTDYSELWIKGQSYFKLGLFHNIYVGPQVLKIPAPLTWTVADAVERLSTDSERAHLRAVRQFEDVQISVE